MATKPAPAQSQAAAAKTAATSAVQGKAAPPQAKVPAAGVQPLSPGPVAKSALDAAKSMPGWKAARALVGEALASGATAVLFEAGKGVTRAVRIDGAWQPAEELPSEDGVAAFKALHKLATAVPAGQEEPEFVVGARKLPRRPCRVAARTAGKSEQVIVLLGAVLPTPERRPIKSLVAAALGRLVPSFLKRTPPPPERDPSLPVVALEATGADAASRQSAIVESEGYATACDLVAAAVRDRAGEIRIEAGPQGVSLQFDVDGVAAPPPPLERAALAAVAGVWKAVAGLDPQIRGQQRGKVTAVVQGKPWACSVVAARGSGGERIEFVIEHMRPKFKTLPEAGADEQIARRVHEFLLLESGLVILAAPRRGGLSTLFDTVINSADRLMRDYVLLEDATTPRPEVQNVKPVRWDAKAGVTPVAALESAMRDYPHVVTVCDLDDAELAKALVERAGDGRLVIVGVRADDAVDGIARLVALGVEPEAISRVLLGAVGVRLVRKLCPKCRQEYFPAVEMLTRLKIDPVATPTLFRAAASGCPVCTATGYLGRTAACELATGPTLRSHLAKGADPQVLRQAAVKDGMATVQHDAVAKVARGTTSVEEIQRAFRRA